MKKNMRSWTQSFFHESKRNFYNLIDHASIGIGNSLTHSMSQLALDSHRPGNARISLDRLVRLCLSAERSSAVEHWRSPAHWLAPFRQHSKRCMYSCPSVRMICAQPPAPLNIRRCDALFHCCDICVPCGRCRRENVSNVTSGEALSKWQCRR